MVLVGYLLNYVKYIQPFFLVFQVSWTFRKFFIISAWLVNKFFFLVRTNKMLRIFEIANSNFSTNLCFGWSQTVLNLLWAWQRLDRNDFFSRFDDADLDMVSVWMLFFWPLSKFDTRVRLHVRNHRTSDANFQWNFPHLLLSWYCFVRFNNVKRTTSKNLDVAICDKFWFFFISVHNQWTT